MSTWGTRRLASLTIALLGSWLVACGDYSTGSPVPAPSTPIARVVVTPSAVTLESGESATLVAKAFDASGSELQGRAMIWTSRNESIVEVDPYGELLAKAVGTAIVSVRMENQVAEATVTVRAGVASIAVAPVALLLDVGATRQLTSFIFDADANRLTDRAVVWATDSPEVASVSQTGLVSATGPGYATITATCEGRTFSLAVTVPSGQ